MNIPASTALRGLTLASLVALSGCVVAPPAPRTVYRQPPAPAPQPQLPQPGTTSPPGHLLPGHVPPGARMFFYPERGQNEALQDRDRYQCYRWAVEQTGFDPGMTPVRESAAALPPVAVERSGAPVAAGAVTGAVLGAATSSPRHAGAAMVLGAIFGATLGAAAEEQNARSAEYAQARRAAAARQGNAAMQPLGDFRRAVSACMGGRGYRVG